MTDRPPRLEACYFGGERYRRMARVLEFSARRYSPGWAVHVQEIRPSRYASALSNDSHEHNTTKLAHWTQQVIEAPDGDRLLLMDGDMAIVQPLDLLLDLPFDLAYTVRPERCRYPFNGGVVAVRVGAGVRAFMAAWLQENLRMLTDRAYHRSPRSKYGGINQASFGHLLDIWPDHGLAIAQLPCAIWNCEDTGWAGFNQAVTRILHVKSGLRVAALGDGHDTIPAAKTLIPVAHWWRRLEREALAGEGLA